MPKIDLLALLVDLYAEQEGVKVTYKKGGARNVANGRSAG
jgi:hypothetical protein